MRSKEGAGGDKPPIPARRQWLAQAGMACAGIAALPAWPARGREDEEDVSPPEDLMREHGVLKRVLLVYEEAVRRQEAAIAADGPLVRLWKRSAR